ncbi:MAG: DUF1508 domain-containing protein [Ignavibacteria bacterium]|nr:DUF1508 domain-containing protein [Ignavibacteria bacterium]
MKARIYTDKIGMWRWDIVASNGCIIADSGEGYTRPSSCRNSIEKFIRFVRSKEGHFDYYEDSRGEWRWRYIARNHRIVADSGQGYTRRGSCKRIPYRILDAALSGRLVITMAVEE